MELAIADDPLARNPGEGSDRGNGGRGGAAESSPAKRGRGTMRSMVEGARSMPRKNSLDEMTIRRTEVPAGGPRPAKPSLDRMGPGTDRETPIPKPAPPKPRSVGGRPGSPVGRGKRRR
jgi:excinuclease ABC subunit B